MRRNLFWLSDEQWGRIEPHLAIFEMVEWWAKEGMAVNRAHRALHLRGHKSVREPEPFAAVILCTSDVIFRFPANSRLTLHAD